MGDERVGIGSGDLMELELCILYPSHKGFVDAVNKSQHLAVAKRRCRGNGERYGLEEAGDVDEDDDEGSNLKKTIGPGRNRV